MKNPSTLRIVLADGWRENLTRNAIWNGGNPLTHKSGAVGFMRISMSPDFTVNFISAPYTGKFKTSEATITVVYEAGK